MGWKVGERIKFVESGQMLAFIESSEARLSLIVTCEKLRFCRKV
jgi:hypothetical protein